MTAVRLPRAPRREGSGGRRNEPPAPPAERLRSVLAPSWSLLLALASVLLVLVPPNGVLHGNEEAYFGQAAVNFGDADRNGTAFLDPAGHRVLTELVLARVVALLGYETAQVVLRSLAVLLCAWALACLCKEWRVPVGAAVAAVATFGVLDQHVLGREWLFRAFEAKVVAYALVLLALALVTRGRLSAGMLLAGLATWFHFLVGFNWGVVLLVWIFLVHRTVRPLGAYVLPVLPVLALLVARHGDSLVGRSSAAGLDVDYVYSVLRNPHHVAPFSSWAQFLSWAPGIGLLAALCVGCGYLLRRSGGPARRELLLVALVLGQLVLALAVAAVDRGGVFGKLYLFRPSSLLLLLVLLLAMRGASELVRSRTGGGTWVLPVAALLVLLPRAGVELSDQQRYEQSVERSYAGLLAHLREDTPADAAVIVHPALENELLRLERRTGRGSFVSWKYVPTDEDAIVTWYGRLQEREAFLTTGCARQPRVHTGYLLVPVSTDPASFAACAQVDYEDAAVRLLRLRPAAS